MQKIVRFYIDTYSLHKKTHTQVLLSYIQSLYLLVLLTFEIQAHVNTQTNLHSLHTFRQKKSRITDWHSYVFTYNHINVPFILIYDYAEVLA